jgi:SOS-response transcriptional repressor LexA
MVKMDENRKKQQQAREKVRFLRRRMLESSFSKLSAREIEERCNKPEIKEISELSDVLRPECSLWLKEILADLRVRS